MDSKTWREKASHSLIEAYEELLSAIEEKKDLNIFLTVDRDRVLSRVRELEEKKRRGETTGRLYGLPVAVKDNIMTKGLRTTCASNILKDYVPFYNASVIERLEAADAVVLGKVNMDEFAMGGSSETSAFGPTRNPLDPSLVPGGSSSGSAAAVAADLCVLSLGTDTGGSVRNPASYCSVVGFMPSYGSISRYGVASMANTLDVVGLVGNSVEDIAMLFTEIAGRDERDQTSVARAHFEISLEDATLSGKRVGILRDLSAFSLMDEVRRDYEEALKILESRGAILEEIEIPHLVYASSLYTLIMSVEVSSNLSRYDGIRYGSLCDDYETTEELYVKTRSRGLGEEVKRRIAMGTHFLAAEYGRKLYDQGLRVRRLLTEDFEKAFEKVDLIATPTTSDIPYPLGAKVDDPMASYDSGDFNVPVNLCGLCAISLPVHEGIGGSLQLVGPRHGEEELLRAARCFERRND